MSEVDGADVISEEPRLPLQPGQSYVNLRLLFGHGVGPINKLSTTYASSLEQP